MSHAQFLRFEEDTLVTNLKLETGEEFVYNPPLKLLASERYAVGMANGKVWRISVLGDGALELVGSPLVTAATPEGVQ